MGKSPEEAYVEAMLKEWKQEGPLEKPAGGIDSGPNPNAKPLEVRSDLSAGNWSVTRDSLLLIQPDPPTKRCPKCGHGNTSGSIIFSGEAMGDLAGEYCGRCLAEWTAQHVPKMVEVGK